MRPDPRCLLAAAEKRPPPMRGAGLHAAQQLLELLPSHRELCFNLPLAGKSKSCPSRSSFIAPLPGTERRAPALASPFSTGCHRAAPASCCLVGGFLPPPGDFWQLRDLVSHLC